MSIYDTLNPQQKEAVLHNEGPLLLLAGAGSGKTRVLTHRIAYLIDHRGVNPWNILAITFTNKAASEMRERVDDLVGFGSEDIWVSTFHSTCVRILRRYIDTIGYERNFTIYDADDQKTLVRDICKYLNIDTKKTKERTFISAISKAKDELITPNEYAKNAGNDLTLSLYAKVYIEYQKRLKNSNALDFDDLIVKTVELLRKNPDALNYYYNRFRYIMVDEYQDTNTAQFKLIHLLSTGPKGNDENRQNLCVVGDDDQSIYKFRGANIENILNFEGAFPSAVVIKLEQNYRSTKSILDAANEVISNNTHRKVKALWTDNEEGDPIKFTIYDNGYDEAETIASEIHTLNKSDNVSYKDFAILYRTNAQSRLFEEKLIARNIPYKIIGSINFYARKEIKDILAYLKTINNGKDSLSTLRIINSPRRGIGLTTTDRVSNFAIENELSFYEALGSAHYIPGVERAASKIMPFVSFIEGIKSNMQMESYTLRELIEDVLEGSGYLTALDEDSDENKDRLANIDELVNKIVSYEEISEEPSLSGFLEEIALVADIDNLDESADYVVLMTLHSAKGLEFPHVYIAGFEEGIFPSYMTLNAENPEEELQEERRLCYVGITRAKNNLALSAAKQRMIRGETQFNKPSRFISEIPRHLVTMGASSSSSPSSPFAAPGGRKPWKQTTPYMAPSSKNIPGNNLGSLDYEIGDTVKHIKFGIGDVKDITMGGRDYEVTVGFHKYGTKKLLASFAKLKKVN